MTLEERFLQAIEDTMHSGRAEACASICIEEMRKAFEAGSKIEYVDRDRNVEMTYPTFEDYIESLNNK